jgi:phosphoribosyl 1,2-cyclic phosphodiesterase
LLLSHHDPEHDDATMDAIVAQTKKLHPATSAACEGDVISIQGTYSN